jgi:2-dehydro-3-deoxyglucarate aldolase
MEQANGSVTCCIQIETHEALAALDQLLEVPGVDTVLMGPNDLAASLGHTGQITHPEVEEAIAHIVERAKAHGIPAGAWAQSTAIARKRREQGYRWATVNADYSFLVKGADAAVREVREG